MKLPVIAVNMVKEPWFAEKMLDAIGKGVYVRHYLDAMDKLSKYDVVYKPGTKLLENRRNCAVLENLEDGSREEYPSD